MTAIALKESLIKKISRIKNKRILTSIDEFVSLECDTFNSNNEIKLTPTMIKLLEMSEDDYKNGRTVPHEQVMAEMDVWLRERA